MNHSLGRRSSTAHYYFFFLLFWTREFHPGRTTKKCGYLLLCLATRFFLSANNMIQTYEFFFPPLHFGFFLKELEECYRCGLSECCSTLTQEEKTSCCCWPVRVKPSARLARYIQRLVSSSSCSWRLNHEELNSRQHLLLPQQRWCGEKKTRN